MPLPQKMFSTKPINFKNALPNVADLEAAQLIVERREVRQGRADYFYKEVDEQKLQPQLTTPGTFTIFLAKPGNPTMESIRKAVKGGAAEDVHQASAEIKKSMERQTAVSLPEAIKKMKKAPLLGEVRYKNQVVARHLFVEKQEDIAVISLPYSGLSVRKGDLAFYEYFTQEKAGYDVIFFINAIPLSEAEKLAFSNASKTGLLGHNPVALPYTVEVAVMVLLYVLLAKPADFKAQHLSKDQIKQLGPNASVRELLLLRRKLLLNKVG